MITNPHILEAFEQEIRRTENLTLAQKFSLLDGMYELACKFGHFRPDRDVHDIDHTVRLARIINSIVHENPR